MQHFNLELENLNKIAKIVNQEKMKLNTKILENPKLINKGRQWN